MKEETTEWYPKHIKPVRRGVYQVCTRYEIGFAFWSGKRWGMLFFNQALTYTNTSITGADQNKTWRGLAQRSVEKEFKLTPWYPDDVRPAHVGVYMRDYTYGNFFSVWNGRFWLIGDKNIKQAVKQNEMSVFQNLPWRGFTEKQT